MTGPRSLSDGLLANLELAVPLRRHSEKNETRLDKPPMTSPETTCIAAGHGIAIRHGSGKQTDSHRANQHRAQGAVFIGERGQVFSCC
jgi:hypothetical protein